MECEIQWIDSDGRPTPDQNIAIGYAVREAYVEQYPGAMGGAIRHDARRFRVCAAHARQISGLEHWHFEASTAE